MAHYEKMNVFCNADKNRDIKIMTRYKHLFPDKKDTVNTPREKIGWGKVPRVEDYFRMSRPVSKPVKLCAFMRTNIKSVLLQMVHLLACYQNI